MGSAEFALDMILMKQMAGITNFQTIQAIQAMPEHSDLDGDSTGSSVTNLALEEPEAMQSEAIEKEVISIADIPAAAAGIFWQLYGGRSLSCGAIVEQCAKAPAPSSNSP